MWFDRPTKAKTVGTSNADSTVAIHHHPNAPSHSSSSGDAVVGNSVTIIIVIIVVIRRRCRSRSDSGRATTIVSATTRTALETTLLYGRH